MLKYSMSDRGFEPPFNSLPNEYNTKDVLNVNQVILKVYQNVFWNKL